MCLQLTSDWPLLSQWLYSTVAGNSASGINQPFNKLYLRAPVSQPGWYSLCSFLDKVLAFLVMLVKWFSSFSVAWTGSTGFRWLLVNKLWNWALQQIKWARDWREIILDKIDQRHETQGFLKVTGKTIACKKALKHYPVGERSWRRSRTSCPQCLFSKPFLIFHLT